jgi:hypothetical protein
MNDLEQVEIQIDVAKSMRSLRDSYVKLSNTKAFKDVIEKGYFQEEAARLVMAKSNPNLGDDSQKMIDNMITGVGALAQYFDMVMRRGAEMDEAIGEHEQTRQDILAEDITDVDEVAA